MPTQVPNSEVREGRQVKETPDQAALSPGQAAGGTRKGVEGQNSVPEDPKGPLVTTDYDKDFPILETSEPKGSQVVLRMQAMRLRTAAA